MYYVLNLSNKIIFYSDLKYKYIGIEKQKYFENDIWFKNQWHKN